MNQLDYQNPLFLHPSGGPGFITATISRSVTDNASAEQWDTCNKQVISWLMNFVSNSVAKSVMFIGTAVEIWKPLEKCFALSNGSRKYKLHKETYAMVQQGMINNEYYTKLKCIWEELDSMNQLPRVTNVTPEINAFLAAYNQQKEEQHLFQFLNGLDEHYSFIRSQLLLMTPLPNVESACSMLQEEESQKEMFSNFESTALYSRNIQSARLQERSKQNSGKVKSSQPKRSIANVQGNNVMFISEQFKQLLKCLHQLNKNDMQSNDDSDNEIDHHFIADTGATYHITPMLKYLSDSKSLFWKSMIRLPNGDSSVISHVGNITLNNGINLKGVLVVPKFKFSFLSVPKLTKEKSCAVIFFSHFCVIQDLMTKKVIGLGERRAELYYLVNMPLYQVDKRLTKLIKDSYSDSSLFSIIKEASAHSSALLNSYSLLNQRLGHVLKSKLNHITCISDSVENSSNDIKMVRSDNALEFVKGELGAYLRKKSVVHQTSCPHRPQQNGRVERQHRHILDTARALRLHSCLPLKFPSPLLKNKTPYEVLLKKVLTYDHLKVFGCLAMASNPTIGADKFDARCIPCVFFGYISFSKNNTTYTSLVHGISQIHPTVYDDPVMHQEEPASDQNVTSLTTNQVSSPSLDPQFQSYITALLAHSDPAHVYEAINDPGWYTAMNDELGCDTPTN
ncbi:uncharacterized protein [Rutidosis leptorrhynchoides]|uniref:uncharacterized protein n=1 Tax=Rutidosis leptorrhynchoides TaxID=125765 RepID=UPI003A990ABC